MWIGGGRDEAASAGPFEVEVEFDQKFSSLGSKGATGGVLVGVCSSEVYGVLL